MGVCCERLGPYIAQGQVGGLPIGGGGLVLERAFLFEKSQIPGPRYPMKNFPPLALANFQRGKGDPEENDWSRFHSQFPV